jgi:hypothetical protein
MSVVIGQLQIDTEGEAAAGAKAPPRRAPSSPTAASAPPAPVRVQTQSVLRHHRERLARVRST